VPEWHVEQSARSGHLDIRSDDRLSAADRRPHGFAEHRVNARTAMLHFASNPDDRTLPLLQWVRLIEPGARRDSSPEQSSPFSGGFAKSGLKAIMISRSSRPARVPAGTG
jgi:hypothetical protein